MCKLVHPDWKSRISIPVAATILLIVVCQYIVFLNYEFVGDDLGYLCSINRMKDKWGALLGMVAQPTMNFIHVNGRMGDKVNTLLFGYMPRAVCDLILACTVGGMLVAVLKAIRFPRRNLAGKSLIITLMAFTLPWWDGFNLRVINLNYTLTLLFALIVLMTCNRRRHGWRKWLYCLFALIAAAFHEACGLSIAAAFIGQWIFRRYLGSDTRFNAAKIAWCLGALIVPASPGFWRRIGSASEGLLPWWETLIISDYYVLLLLIAIAAFATIQAGRIRLRDLLKTDWTIFAIAACASAVISAYSGIIGRTGMFAQVFALIALARLLITIPCHSGSKPLAIVKNIFAYILLLTVCAHYIVVAKWQTECGTEMRQIITDYAASTDGVVFADYLRDPEIPWYTLHKARPIPDPDDVWPMEMFKFAYHEDDPGKPLVILPTEARNILGNGKIPRGESTYIGEIPEGKAIRIGRDYIASALPTIEKKRTFEDIDLSIAYGIFTPDTVNEATISNLRSFAPNPSTSALRTKTQLFTFAPDVVNRDVSIQWVVQSFRIGDRTYLLLSRRDLDWGDIDIN